MGQPSVGSCVAASFRRRDCLWYQVRFSLSTLNVFRSEGTIFLCTQKLKGGFFSFFLLMYDIQRCFICRSSDFNVLEDAGIEPRTVATTALAVRRSYPHSARSRPQSTRSHPLSARSHLVYPRKLVKTPRVSLRSSLSSCRNQITKFLRSSK